GLVAAAVELVRVDGARAGPLLVPEDVELVALAGLQRQPCGPHLPALSTLRLLGQVRYVEPLGVVARVLVRVHAGNRADLTLLAERGVVPEPVLLDRPADAHRHIPLLEERARRGE